MPPSARSQFHRVDRCVKAVEALADRLQREIDQLNRGERVVGMEPPEGQLQRLLSEVGQLHAQLSETESALSKARALSHSGAQLEGRLRLLNAEMDAIRTAVHRAAAGLNLRVQPSERTAHELAQLVEHFRRVQMETAALSASLDASLTNVTPAERDGFSLSQKVEHVIATCAQMRAEGVTLRQTLDWCLVELNVNVSTKLGMDDKLRALVKLHKSANEREHALRGTLRKQHASLHTAYQRVKMVEGELTRSQGVAAEERDLLARSALHALQQLRHHLGAVHALRPELVRSLDEALTVHSPPAMLRGSPGSAQTQRATAAMMTAAMMQTSPSAPNLGASVAADAARSPIGCGHLMDATSPSRSRLHAPTEVARIDAFMAHIAGTASALVHRGSPSFPELHMKPRDATMHIHPATPPSTPGTATSRLAAVAPMQLDGSPSLPALRPFTPSQAGSPSRLAYLPPRGAYRVPQPAAHGHRGPERAASVLPPPTAGS